MANMNAKPGKNGKSSGPKPATGMGKAPKGLNVVAKKR